MDATVLITGDFCPIGRIQNLIEKEDFYEIFNDFTALVKNSDLAITNLECSLTESTNENEKTGPCLKAPIKSIEALKFAGFNLVTLANNHIMDFGTEGLNSTLKSCQSSNIDFIGAGRTLNDARKPYITIIKGKKIGVLNFAENEFISSIKDEATANPFNLTSNFRDIKELRDKVDFLLVIYHGGREHYQLPTPNVRDSFRFFVDAGADAIVGHHTHCSSGYEIYNKKPIFYSLGNFVFDFKKKYQKGLWTDGYAVKFFLKEENIDFEIIPFWQGREEDATLKLMKGDDKEQFLSKIKNLNTIIKDDDMFFKSWEDYLKTQRESYKALLFVQNKYIRKLMDMGFWPKIYFQSKAHKTLLTNLFKCETHREIMIETLKERH